MPRPELPGKAQPPHNHTTWALISGVFGDEHNVAYQRISETTLEQRWELTCQRGNAVAFQPDDFHTIEVTSTGPALHLHLYGRSLAHLPDRVFIKDKVDGRWQGAGAPLHGQARAVLALHQSGRASRDAGRR